MPNFNAKTGLPFGVVGINSLNGDVVDEIFSSACDSALDVLLRDWREENPDTDDDVFWDELSDGDWEVSGDFCVDGIHGRLTCLGGGYIAFSYDGPPTNVRSYCSPCVPGAADIDSGDGEISCHGFPSDWLDRCGT